MVLIRLINEFSITGSIARLPLLMADQACNHCVRQLAVLARPAARLVSLPTRPQAAHACSRG